MSREKKESKDCKKKKEINLISTISSKRLLHYRYIFSPSLFVVVNFDLFCCSGSVVILILLPCTSAATSSSSFDFLRAPSTALPQEQVGKGRLSLPTATGDCRLSGLLFFSCSLSLSREAIAAAEK